MKSWLIGIAFALALFSAVPAHAQFSVVSRGPISGGCNPPALGLDFVNNVIYSCGGSPPQWQSSGLSCQGGTFTLNAILVVTSGGGVSCNGSATIVQGSESSISMPDNVTVANAAPTQMKLASVAGVPSIGFNGPVSAIETAANVGVANGIAGLNGSAVLPIAEVVNSLTNCDSSHVIKGDQSCGNALGITTDSVSNTSQSLLNFLDAAAFHGLTLTWTNPGGGGNEQPVIGGSLDLATQNHPSMTINGTICTLGSTCNPSGSSGSTLLNSQGPLTAVTGTGAVATLYTFSIPGGTMGTATCIRAHAEFQHTTGSASITYTWNYAGTTSTSSGSAGLGAGQDSVTICNTGATNAQVISFHQLMFVGNTVVQGTAVTTSAIDTTTSQTLSFQFTVAATDAVTPKLWMVESVHN